MRILTVSNYQPPHMGGIEFAVEALKHCWQEEGHEVTWLTTNIPRRPELQQPGNVRVGAANIFEHTWQINSPLPYPWGIPLIRRLIRAHDVVNVHSLAPGLSTLTLALALNMKKPVVTTQHVGIIALRQAWLSGLQRRFICGMAHWGLKRGMRLTFVGEAVRQWFVEQAGIPPAETVMTPAGVDPGSYYFVPDAGRPALLQKWALSSQALNVLFVGRFYEKKGLPLIQEVARALPHVQFTLVGKGPIDPAQWGLPNVRLIGYVETPELRELYGAHDLFIMPSFGEGWPAVVPQAMACGLTCLLSPETFAGYARDPERFVLCPRQPLEMTRLLEDFSRNPRPLREHRAETSRYALDQWNWMKTARIYLGLFQELLPRPEIRFPQ